MKVFIVGLHKTGTTSIHYMMKRVGLRSFHWRGVGQAYHTGEFDCLSDWATGLNDPMKWEDIMNNHPECLMVLNTRPLADWVESKARHEFFRQTRNGAVPTKSEMHKWIANRRDVHRQYIERIFLNTPEQSLILNINSPGWLEKLINTIRPFYNINKQTEWWSTGFKKNITNKNIADEIISNDVRSSYNTVRDTINEIINESGYDSEELLYPDCDYDALTGHKSVYI